MGCFRQPFFAILVVDHKVHEAAATACWRRGEPQENVREGRQNFIEESVQNGLDPWADRRLARRRKMADLWYNSA